jgi:hypothetical protein
MDVLNDLRHFLTKPHVRPWALSTPIVVLLLCLPLLRPLRHPDPRLISDDELGRLATVQSLVEHRTLAIDRSTAFFPSQGVIHRGQHTYSDQPPTLAVLLSGPYWVMRKFDLTFHNNPALVAYLLTLIGVTIPVALGSGLIYRMGRMFELPRPKRALLALVVALGSGFVSYGVVLNAQAPAAALVLAATAAIVHVTISRRAGVTSGWLAIAGMAAMLAAAINPAAVAFFVLLGCSIFVMRWRLRNKVGGLILYLLGASGPFILHAALMKPITGDVLPPRFHSELIAQTAAPASAADAVDDDLATAGWWDALGRNLTRLTAAFFGRHGIFSHFPVLVFGVLGVAAVMHRHWPMTTKALATATLVGGGAIIVVCSLVFLVGPGTMFGPQMFILFLPLTLFWAGAWLRKRHHAVTWAGAGILLVFSASASILGATDPCPREGYDGYTVAQALSNLIHPEDLQTPAVLANR